MSIEKISSVFRRRMSRRAERARAFAKTPTRGERFQSGGKGVEYAAFPDGKGHRAPRFLGGRVGEKRAAFFPAAGNARTGRPRACERFFSERGRKRRAKRSRAPEGSGGFFSNGGAKTAPRAARGFPRFGPERRNGPSRARKIPPRRRKARGFLPGGGQTRRTRGGAKTARRLAKRGTRAGLKRRFTTARPLLPADGANGVSGRRAGATRRDSRRAFPARGEKTHAVWSAFPALPPP